MPTLYELKPRFQALLRPIAGWLVSVGITANQVTVCTCCASVGLGAWLSVTHRGWVLLPVFLFVRMALNATDGLMAREHNQKSALGAVLNELTDVLADAALSFPFVTLPGLNPLWIAAAIFFAALTEMAGLVALVIGKARRNDGPFGKSDRAFALGFLGSWVALGWPVADWAPMVWIGLCSVTIVQRVRRALS